MINVQNTFICQNKYFRILTIVIEKFVKKVRIVTIYDASFIVNINMISVLEFNEIKTNHSTIHYLPPSHNNAVTTVLRINYSLFIKTTDF